MKKWLTLALSLLLSLTLFGAFASAAEVTEAASYDEMIALIRDGLLAREETIRFRYTGDDYRAPSPDDLFAYGDNGAAGDYLRLSFNGAFPAAVQEEDGSYTVTPSYYTTASQEAAVAAYVSDVLAGCTATEEEAVARYLYDYLCDNVQFDLENLYNEADLLKYTAYGAVSEGKAVCQGFAQLYYRLAKAAGLDCRIVTGTRAGENHAWNIVKLGDKWYHVDAACGAQLLDNSGYFMKPLFNKYAIVYGDYTAAEIRSYPFATASGMNDNLITGTISYTISYTLDQSTGVLTISGSGDLPYYAGQNMSPFFFNGRIKSAVISEGITGIRKYLLPNCDNLEEISIPASVTFIESRAFNRCRKLERFIVDSENAVFYSSGSCIVKKSDGTLIVGCDNSVIPDDGSITAIGSCAFADCSGLSEIIIPEGVTRIGNSAFSGCTGLTQIQIPDGVTSLSGFYGCTGLTEITIPDSVTEIGPYAFQNCSGLTEISLPDGLTEIGISAFSGCAGLTAITIPGSVKQINNSCFSGCKALETLIILNGVEGIEMLAFNGCSSLREVSIPASLTDIGSYPFSSCTLLERITVDADNPKYWSDERGALYRSKRYQQSLIQYPAGNPATSYSISEGTWSISAGALSRCRNLREISIPGSVVLVNNGAFSECSNLKALYIPKSVQTIDTDAFTACSSLESIEVDSGNIFYHSSGNCLIHTANKELIVGCRNSVIPDDGSVISIKSNAFLCCAGLQEITIPECVTTIGSNAFASCTNLKRITLPGGITRIENGTFYGCRGLKSVVLPNALTYIGSNAFKDCASLTEITIPEGTTQIEYGAFQNCTSLTLAYIPQSVYSFSRQSILENTTFGNCSSLTICGQAGSKAETYAQKYHIPFAVACPATKRPHTIVAFDASAVTCTEAGYTAGERCADCGEWISGHELTEAPLGHDPAEAVRENVVEPTCTAEGSYDNVIYCARCGELLSSTPEKLAMTPHRDEVRDGYCDDCGAYICEHKETKTANEKAASCTEDGYSGDTVCDVCGVTLTYGQTVPAPGHKPYISKAAVSATCLATGSTAQVSCSVCQTVLTESVETPIVWHMDENGDGACDVCRAPLDCDRYGLCGDDCYWYVDNGTLVISGSGATYSYTDPAPWAADDFDYVYIKEGVTAVEGASFDECANVTKVFTPAGTSVSGCEKPVLTYTFTDGVAAISGATGDGAFNAYDLLNAAYVFCLDHEVKGLRFDRLQLNAADGSEFTEYDILKSGKIVDENHFRLSSGAVVNDFFVKPASYASFNRVQTLFGSEPDRNLILRVECGDLLTDEMKTDGNAYTEQLVLRFVDEPAPAEDDGHHGFMDSFIERFRATLAAILALFKKIIKLFTGR